jgi:O-antigen ligase
MMPLRERATRVGVTQGLQVALLEALAATYGVGVVALFVSGRVDVVQAGVLLGGPVVFALALLRPEWTILALVAAPPQLLSSIPPRLLIAIALLTVFGFFLRGRLHIGIKTGVVPLLAIIVLAVTRKTEMLGDDEIAAAAADTTLKLIVFYALLMLAGFHSAARGGFRIDSFINAMLVGLAFGAMLEPFFVSQSFESLIYHPFRSHFAYLAVMGFGVTYIRLSLRSSAGQSRSSLDVFLMIVFLVLTLIGFSRAAWMAGLLVFALVSLWTGRKSFWIVLSLCVMLALTVPVIGARILPSGSVSTDPDTLALLTTGRSVLWGKLWAQGAEALPFGKGWGYVESLSPLDLFGIEGEFNSGGSPFVYPHNDFVYLFVQFGVVGFGLLVVYWLNLLRRVRSLARRRATRYSVRLLLPIIIVMFFVQLFDNGFAIVSVATRFFIAAGIVFGLHYATRESAPAEIEASSRTVIDA